MDLKSFLRPELFNSKIYDASHLFKICLVKDAETENARFNEGIEKVVHVLYGNIPYLTFFLTSYDDGAHKVNDSDYTLPDPFVDVNSAFFKLNQVHVEDLEEFRILFCHIKNPEENFLKAVNGMKVRFLDDFQKLIFKIARKLLDAEGKNFALVLEVYV